MSQPPLKTRQRLVALIRKFPGLHLRELARQAELSEALANYHLNALVEDGVVSDVNEQGYRRFYLAARGAPAEADRALLAVLRKRAPLQIVLILLEQPHATHQEITQALGLAKSTVSYHLAHLVEARVLVSSPEGGRFALREPQRMQRLLLKWEPPQDITDRFASLWRSFYDRQTR